MKAECWECGEVETFDDKQEFIAEGWTRLGVGDLGRISNKLKSGEQRDYCNDCIQNVDVVDEVERMIE